MFLIHIYFEFKILQKNSTRKFLDQDYFHFEQLKTFKILYNNRITINYLK